ncbi:MAG TPA: aromatic ring-hydroxylating dioxygenase subunit alpha [Stellaceae bacterium]|jgi:vanillate O-demethylase monooxygenase subunit|nr:aromatic ring-hydroxylating dioxygenase subunit alpha [Stellaceae bacterium]
MTGSSWVNGFRYAYQDFPRNAWYVIGFSHELEEGPLVRRICGDRVVMFRGAKGEPVALLDRCPHRAAPLSHGKLAGEGIQCPYHGIEFGTGGKCLKIPSQDRIPDGMRARSYPIKEVWKWLWIWPGDPAKADTTLIPDHDGLRLTDKDWYAVPSFIVPMEGSFEMLHENLLDTSHISFLHEGAFDAGAMAGTLARVEVEGSVIKIWRELMETATAQTAASFELVPGRTYRRTLLTEARVPNLEIVTNIFEDPDGKAPPRIRSSIIGVTPGGPLLCYQINARTTNYAIPPELFDIKSEATRKMTERVLGVIHQDRDMLRTVQQNYNEAGDNLGETSVLADNAAIRFRRLMIEMIAAERAS